MTTTSTASTGKVVSSLVRSYGELVHSNDEGIRNWWREAVKSGVSVRDLSATITKAKEQGEIRGIKPAYANNARLAVEVFEIQGAGLVPVADLMKVVEVAQRALKIEGALELISRVDTFAQFEAKAKEAESMRPKKDSKAGRKASPVETRGATADAIISKALADLGELEDITITDFEKAEYLIGALKSALASSKSMKAKHPTRKAVNA